ncbi:Crp/Fnr family transcriptional regulator [Aquincola tertiaricarbonis]|uniref:Crp/Fnr family transcriptional regulator n=1 Tax=Aquincola tertiaricarbonis TaxID=391953 RepID=A0ABY4S5W1_AQUTE|nr:Crp/Fnr family transcriptional regulator [Aquincola tertiaricarbonis]URI07272.1 Crp/Fnr family transcriptional regulator [Aquincola tertiaricarbonis]
MTLQQNHLIGRLPRRERERLQGLSELVQLARPDVIHDQARPLRHVYFPVDGCVSLLTQLEAHPSVEVGMVGREGMLGTWLVLGVPRVPLQAVVQGSGSAWRLGTVPLRRELLQSPAMRRVFERYVVVLMTQLATSSACLRFHHIEPRLARWLLMTQDRAHADRFPVTHEFLASLLGVRRAGVTLAAGALQARGQITYHRGVVVVLDRAGLEGSACSCYAADRRVYDTMLG